jgi:hypothetical protein
MIASLILMAGAAASPMPMLGKCEVSKLWGTELPADIPMEQQRQLIHVQGKQLYWNTRLMTVARAVTDIAPDVAQGDLLVIDASEGKCPVVKELAAAIEAPAACTPERCFVSSKAVPARRAPKEGETP